MEGLTVLIVLAVIVTPLVVSVMAFPRSRELAAHAVNLRDTVDQLSGRDQTS